MTQMIDRVPLSEDIVTIAKRAGLYQLLLSALQRQKRVQELPGHLYNDLGIPPSQRPDFTPHCR